MKRLEKKMENRNISLKIYIYIFHKAGGHLFILAKKMKKIKKMGENGVNNKEMTYLTHTSL